VLALRGVVVVVVPDGDVQLVVRAEMHGPAVVVRVPVRGEVVVLVLGREFPNQLRAAEGRRRRPGPGDRVAADQVVGRVGRVRSGDGQVQVDEVRVRPGPVVLRIEGDAQQAALAGRIDGQRDGRVGRPVRLNDLEGPALFEDPELAGRGELHRRRRRQVAVRSEQGFGEPRGKHGGRAAVFERLDGQAARPGRGTSPGHERLPNGPASETGRNEDNPAGRQDEPVG
jgi:hypothetical protein